MKKIDRRQFIHKSALGVAGAITTGSAIAGSGF